MGYAKSTTQLQREKALALVKELEDLIAKACPGARFEIDNAHNEGFLLHTPSKTVTFLEPAILHSLLKQYPTFGEVALITATEQSNILAPIYQACCEW